ncbi:hypothetical protein K491DRAFT_779719 [Lophiostoma macrostomum CBS 122681]|uniref:BTB domain-containing protein n=1 Tax=Lophiostoma macrostomum CBS 122681 TaxID=1314788 RepID=A0A6A6T338_9PLEO|nr:hypothetical protein K491DRAFT_779719 [Lophiostoma macrostomum CBS 122681]
MPNASKGVPVAETQKADTGSHEAFSIIDTPASSAGTSIIDNDSDSSTVENEGRRVIDTEGDLTLIVVSKDRETTVSFKVDSTIIRKASPKWSEIYASGSETDDSISIEEDKVDVLEMVLHIAHLQFDLIPLHITFAHLVDVAELLHRHRLTTLLHEYLRNWCRPYTSKILDSGYEMWILIAHEFGWDNIFQIVARKVYTTMYMCDGEYWVGNVHLSEENIGKRILESLIKHRCRHLKLILDACDAAIEKYSTAESQCGHKEHGGACASMVLGSLLRGLKTVGVWPKRPKLADVQTSIVSFKGDVNFIVTQSHTGLSYDCDDDWFLLMLDTAEVESKTEFVKIDHDAVSVPARLRDDEPCSWQSNALKYYEFEERDFVKDFHLEGNSDSEEEEGDEEDNGEGDNDDDEAGESEQGEDESGKYDNGEDVKHDDESDDPEAYDKSS